MKNLNKVIEARANEILRVRRIKFMLDFISKSKTSVTRELEDFEIPKSTYYDWKKKYELGGRFTLIFWVVVVGLGVILPGILEIMELRGKKIPIYIPALLILIGGLIFRYVIVEAGQLTGYIH